MIYTADIPYFEKNKKSVITLGKFDGLHRGHQKLISRVLELGKEGYETVVFTFDVSPLIKLGKIEQKVLLTNEERRELIAKQGIHYLVECHFTEAVIRMEAQEFVTEFLVKRLHAAKLIVGTDFRFGHERKGTPELLKEMGKEYGFSVEIIDKEKDGEREISSTYIREELEKGNMEKVNFLLGYSYFTKGEIVHGRHIGHTIGVPTTNLVPPKGKKLPPHGVYVSTSYINEQVLHGITNVGRKPTVGENFVGVETYLFDCNRNLYGEEAQVSFHHYLRPEEKFSSLEKLKIQLQEDEQRGRQYFLKV